MVDRALPSSDIDRGFQLMLDGEVTAVDLREFRVVRPKLAGPAIWTTG